MDSLVVALIVLVALVWVAILSTIGAAIIFIVMVGDLIYRKIKG